MKAARGPGKSADTSKREQASKGPAEDGRGPERGAAQAGAADANGAEAASKVPKDVVCSPDPADTEDVESPGDTTAATVVSAGPVNDTGTQGESEAGEQTKPADADEDVEADGGEQDGDAAKTKGTEDHSDGAGRESACERTSKFVALKTSDTPSLKAPRTGADASLDQAGGEPDGNAWTPSDGVVTAAVATTPEAFPEQPLPPLDLLAQLTNTPAPPKSAMRTIGRRLKVWTPVVLLLGGIAVAAQTVRPLPAPVLTTGKAASSVTLDGHFTVPWPEKGQAAVLVQGSGAVGTHGEQKPVPIASVAKVMTAYVILKDHPLKKNELGPTIEIDAKAVEDGKAKDESRIEGLTEGGKFSQQDMMKMLMIPSGNNIARLLARWDTNRDSQAAFVKKMNTAAKELGMTDTTYTDPSGLDPKTVSTAADQLKLAEAVMKFDAFRAVVQLPNATIKGLPQPINNNNDNLLLAGLSIKGIKTGSNTAAGGTLMWAAYKTVGDKTPLLLGTTLDQRATGPDPDGANSLVLVKDNSQKIIEAVRNALTSATAVRKGQIVGYIDDGLGTRTPVMAAKDAEAVGVPGQKLELTLADGGRTPVHEATAGTEVGVLRVGSGPGATTVPVALKAALTAPSFTAKLTRLG
ncbi:serine hydrolase [Streptomyces sp. x-80]|uniref:serine hydrolase n=1 Tax=Streptomyces sp. x-80 TaxID=2789282 RepID=UPI003980967D